MKQLIGNSPVSHVMPMMEIIAKENGLKLSNLKDFQTCRKLLEERYTLVSIKETPSNRC